MKRVNKNRIKKDPPIKQVKQEKRQTTLAGGTFTDKLIAYRDIHAQALFSSLGRMIATPYSSIMTIAVLAISISSFGFAFSIISSYFFASCSF